MKTSQQQIALTLGLLLSSLSVSAGQVTGSFSTGDPLTASKMTEIQNAVNDNDGRITTLETSNSDTLTDLSCSSGQVAQFNGTAWACSANVTTNAANISTNASGISGNVTAIGNNSTAIGINTTAIGSNTTSISNNASSLSSHTANSSAHHSRYTNSEAVDAVASLMFGGDGSAGDLLVTTSTTWDNSASNIYYNNITISSGQTLTVAAGTTIRCAGSFVNNGTLNVLTGATKRGASSGLSSSGVGAPDSMTAIAHPGDSFSSAALGDTNFDRTSITTTLNGGAGGQPIPQSTAATSFHNFKIGGGAGAGYGPQGGAGGGLVKIYCNGAITNNGIINANGSNATNSSIGGGGGGIVVLASRTSTDNTAGTVNANGGNAVNASWAGNGGGGGGGIVIMVSPTTPIPGTVNLAGGLGGTSTGTLTAAPTYNKTTAGGGGGASGGAGGYGGGLSSTGLQSTGYDGSSGYSITMTLDPLALTR